MMMMMNWLAQMMQSHPLPPLLMTSLLQTEMTTNVACASSPFASWSSFSSSSPKMTMNASVPPTAPKVWGMGKNQQETAEGGEVAVVAGVCSTCH